MRRWPLSGRDHKSCGSPKAAAERIKAVMAKADRPIAAVRVGVKNGGCVRAVIFNNPNQTAACGGESVQLEPASRSAGNLTMMATPPGQAVRLQD
jgi:hypothetical protein